ncbi:MAG: chorismate synthase [Lachnospiraceae bacterium]|nr:chorismate synthase [Lachnospiraceae bacterium]
MAGSSFGTIFRITTWGESHGKALGVVVDGCPAGLELCEKDIQVFLDRRKPGSSAITTQRKESDEVEILSGVFEGKTTGTPISLIVRNQSQISADYDEIKVSYRPGHADYTFDAKYGFRDYRGGGRSSGRETIGRVAAGAIASKLLASLGITVKAYTKSIGPISIDPAVYDDALRLSTPTGMPDAKANEAAWAYLEKARAEQDSVGGCMECVVDGLPAGIGDPVFEKLDANLAKAIMSIGAVKAVEIGDGVAVSQKKGSENNDSFVPIVDEQGITHIGKATNHSGGILGGISDGSQLVIRAHVKPTPSIYQSQKTVNQSGEAIDLLIKGRHDPIIVPRAVVVMECMTAITVLDAMLVGATSKLETLKKIYE